MTPDHIIRKQAIDDTIGAVALLIIFFTCMATLAIFG